MTSKVKHHSSNRYLLMLCEKKEETGIFCNVTNSKNHVQFFFSFVTSCINSFITLEIDFQLHLKFDCKYFFRLSRNLTMTLKHTIKHVWIEIFHTHVFIILQRFLTSFSVMNYASFTYLKLIKKLVAKQ
jgi:hypothetical protein